MLKNKYGQSYVKDTIGAVKDYKDGDDGERKYIRSLLVKRIGLLLLAVAFVAIVFYLF